MEKNDYGVPHLVTVLKQTCFKLNEFIKITLPLIILVFLALRLKDVLDWQQPIATLLSPITVLWLELHTIKGITLIR